MFLYCYYPWNQILNVYRSSRKSADVFSIPVHVFFNLSQKFVPPIWVNWDRLSEEFQGLFFAFFL